MYRTWTIRVVFNSIYSESFLSISISKMIFTLFRNGPLETVAKRRCLTSVAYSPLVLMCNASLASVTLSNERERVYKGPFCIGTEATPLPVGRLNQSRMNYIFSWKVRLITSICCSLVRSMNLTAYPDTRMVKLAYSGFSGWFIASMSFSRPNTLTLR